MKKIVILWIVIASVHALAAPFQNLGFEDAELNSALSSTYGGFPPIEKLLPGWTLLRSGQPVSRMPLAITAPPFYVGPLISDDRGWGSAYNGRLVLGLTERVDGPPDRYELSQVGEIPTRATEMNYAYDGLPFQVRINGEALPEKRRQEVSLPSVTLTLITIDVSRFAGQEVSLSFETIAGPFPEFGAHGIYDITFTGPNRLTIGSNPYSPQADGEPTRVTLGFAVETGHDYIVEFKDNLDPGSPWQPLPGAPHNSGLVIDPSPGPQRFYRLQSVLNSP